MRSASKASTASIFARYASTAATLGAVSTASAAFTGDYSFGSGGNYGNPSGEFGNWTALNDGWNANLELDEGGAFFTFTGSADVNKSWDFTTTATADGTITFDFVDNDNESLTSVGFLQNGNFTLLNDLGSPEQYSFEVFAGDIFGFRALSTGVPITGTIASLQVSFTIFSDTDFHTQSAVPEPASAGLLAGVATLGFAGLRRRKRR